MEKINMFLVKYAEIGTKGKNRYVFEEILCKRIRNRIRSLGEFDVRRDFGRIYVEAKSDFDYDTCLEYLTKINPYMEFVIYTLDFKVAAGMEEILNRYGIRDITTIQISVSKLKSNK